MRRWALIHGELIATTISQMEQPTIEGVWVEVIGPYGAGDRYDGVQFVRASREADRRLTKLQFVARMTPQEFTNLLSAARADVGAEMFVKMLDWATPDPDGTSIDLDDPRTIAGVQASFSAERAAQILA